MQLNQHQDLWNRIRDFEIDDPAASVKYSDKLAHYNGWQKDYALRVIEEYRKFIFLCYVLPQGASPSKAIDEAWHLHLTYTQNYWKGLCAGVLGKELHHFPSKGGSEEKERHVVWYNKTLDAYREILGYEAPSDIWPREQRVRTDTVINDKVADGYFKWYKIYSWFFIFPFLLIIGFYSKINPFTLTGPQFLVFFASLAVTGIVYILLISAKKKEEIEVVIADRYDGHANVYQIARFVYGGERSLRAAIVDLVDRKILEPVKASSFIFNASNYQYTAGEKNPLMINLLKNVKNNETIPYATISNYYDDASTYHAELSNLYKTITVKDRWPLFVTAIIAALGIARIIQGVMNDKPVTYLIIIGIVFIFLMTLVLSMSAGKDILQRIFSHSYKNDRNTDLPSTALASTFVFMGLPYVHRLNGQRELERTFSKHDSSGSYSSGCGSSGCGSDGGCGGGCGGCGGGD